MPDVAIIGPPWRTIPAAAARSILAADPPAIVAPQAWAIAQPRMRLLRRVRGRETAAAKARILAAETDGTALVLRGAVQTTSGQWLWPVVEERVVIDKALDPRRARDFNLLVAQARDRLTRAATTAENAALRDMLPGVAAADWAALGPAEIDLIMDGIEADMLAIATHPRLEQAFVGLGAQTQRVAGATARQFVIRGSRASLSTADRELAQRIGSRSGGVFLTDEYGRRAARYGNQAANIIADSAEIGLDSRAIARELSGALGNAVSGRTESYYQVVANAAVNRARSYGEAVAYREAGIGSYTWVSVLDERTCFAAGTPVRMADGDEERIEDVCVGDTVLSCRGIPGLVIATRAVSKRRWLVVVLANGARVRVTHNHPILTEAGWVRADALRPGDHVVSCRPHGEGDLRGLWADDRAVAGPSVPVLLGSVQDGGARLRLVRSAVPRHADLREPRSGQVLLGALQAGGQAQWLVGTCDGRNVRDLRSRVQPQTLEAAEAQQYRLRAARIDGLRPEPRVDLAEAAALVRVVAIHEQITAPEPAYDLQVRDGAGFVAHGVVVHNSDICGFLDGQVFTVADALARFQRADAAPDPEQALDEFPWYSVVGDPPTISVGLRGSNPRQRTPVATIVTPREGTGVGTYTTQTPPQQTVGTPVPPAHGNCRSLTEPVF